ncbi:redoxin domain-containing protein, partial [Candidatus Sumerlaeota bacterium]|nr:redoxin domain-containing protein [Candidatus Sumerlaeota bacterium]
MPNLSELLDRTYETTVGARTVRQMIEGDRPAVFIAYPMDFTPVCTRQLCSYRDNWADLAKLPVRWWGINKADPAKHRKFKEEKNLPMDLISDSEGDLLRALGM